ncbi:MAG TPA: DUF177 domain-containing protein [Acidimicrobiales bacterium]
MPGRPFAVNVSEELRHPGTRTEVQRFGSLPGIALSTVHIPDDAEISFTGVVEAQGAQVIVYGVARAPWNGECRRCLRPTSGDVVVDLREVFEVHPVEGETYPLVDEQIDLAPVLTESLALGLPLAPLCSEDCPGPDPEGHPVGVVDDAAGSEGESRGDPRWDALDQLRLAGDAGEDEPNQGQDSTLGQDHR